MKVSMPFVYQLLRTVAGVILACYPAAARSSGWERLDTVHFNAGRPDFGTVPRRAAVWYEHTDRPVSHNYENGLNERAVYELDGDKDDAREKQRLQTFAKLFGRAVSREDARDWRGARLEFLRLAKRLSWTGNVRDSVEVLERFERTPKSERKRLVAALRRYLHAMALLEESNTTDTERAFREMSVAPSSGFLVEHALYQLASTAYQSERYPQAIPLYRRYLDQYPRGIKREAALIMLARASILPAKTADETRAGMDAVRQLLHEYPRTRFRSKAIGLAGRYHLLAGHMHQAAWCYLKVGDLASVELVRRQLPPLEAGPIRGRLYTGQLKRLASADSYYQFDQAIYALDRLTKILTATDAFRISVHVAREPEIGASYLYYRIYHCRDNTPRELLRLAHLGDKIAARMPWQNLPPGVRVRLAEAFYQGRQYRKALTWVERASVPSESDRALFVRGAILHKLKRRADAALTFETLLKRFPGSSLWHGAREELALIYESRGDLHDALRQYFLLGYQTDVAYMLDVRMTIPQLENYYRNRADGKKRLWEFEKEWKYSESSKVEPPRYTEKELVAYSLGMRYMRKERWDRAVDWLRRVPRFAYRAFTHGNGAWASKPSPDPLTAIRELSRLQRAIARAKSDVRRAAATYQYATYYYTHGTLLLYNYAAWQGNRRESFDGTPDSRVFTSVDEAATRTHMYEHDVYARTLAMCKQIARKYPHTPTAPKALYRAACSANYLSNFNGWWRSGRAVAVGESQGMRLSNEASHLMSELARRHPHDPLAAPARKYSRVFASSPRDDD